VPGTEPLHIDQDNTAVHRRPWHICHHQHPLTRTRRTSRTCRPSRRAAPLPAAAGAPEHAAAATGQSIIPACPKPARLPGTRPDHRPASRKQAARKDILYLKRCDLLKAIRWRCRLVVSAALWPRPSGARNTAKEAAGPCPYTQINTICESLKRDGSSRMTAHRRFTRGMELMKPGPGPCRSLPVVLAGSHGFPRSPDPTAAVPPPDRSAW
jgi:hypothetical protein